MEKIIKIYREILTYIGIVGLIGFIVSVLIQVIARTFLPTAPNWTEEAARYLFIFMVAFAGNAAVITDEYVGVEMLTEMFPIGVQKTIKIAIAAVLCAFSGFIFYNCVIGPKGLLAVTPSTMVSTALLLPMKYVYTSVAILFGLYVISFIFRIYLIITANKKEG